MKSYQLPLFNLGEIEQSAIPVGVLLTYSAHVELREFMARSFSGEIEILRDMGKLTEAQCPEAWYMAQRELCMTIKKLVNQLDDLNDVMGGSFHAS
jgi:hypothetical protein